MTTEEMVTEVKKNLNITGIERDIDIKDICQTVLNYCNLTDLPLELEQFIRKKVKSIINYEVENGTTNVFDIKSVSVGDTSYTYNVDSNLSKETIYGLSISDKNTLKQFRRIRR
ncbi:MAG: hypothetical protein ACERKZ_05695 [Lachnotalea sp.]